MEVIKTVERHALARKLESSIIGTIKARDIKLHISALMLLRIVDHLTVVDDYPSIGEIHGFYRGHRANTQGTIDYTYGGVSSMLRVLKERGFLKCCRNGRCLTYSLTKTGEIMLDDLYM